MTVTAGSWLRSTVTSLARVTQPSLPWDGRVPALVAPGPPLTAGQVRRYSRHLLLDRLGEEGQRRLRAARVCVIGAGGLGSPVVLYLAAAGVGRIGIVDGDDVELSNLQRQVLHATADVGTPKVESAARRVAALDPGVEVVTHHLRLTAENADLLADYDVVVDGTDTFASRYLINDACVRLGLPEVWGSVLAFDAQVSVFWGRPPVGVPAIQLRDVFPDPPAPGQVLSCAEAGVLGALCGQVGSLMATEVVKLVAGVGTPLLGRILVMDALAARWREIPVVGRAVSDAAATSGGTSSAAPGLAARTRAERRAPGAPAEPQLGELGPTELAALLADDRVLLVDVREPTERAIAALPGALALPLGELLAGGWRTLPTDRPLVAFCHAGVRSRQAGLALLAAGLPEVSHLTGGIDAWSREVDPTVPRY